MKLSEKIIKLRKANGWSQEDLAEKLNVSRQAISRWENGTALPDAQNILQISTLFRVTTDYLLHDNDEVSDVSNAEKPEDLRFKKKRLHLIAAICFTIAWFCALISIVTYVSEIQLGISCFTAALCAFNAVMQFTLFFKKG